MASARTALFLCALLGAAPAAAEKAGPLPGGGAPTPVAAFLGGGGQAYAIKLPQASPVPAQTGPGPRQTGVVHFLPAPVPARLLAWEPVPGGHAARVRLVSEQAAGLRLHLAKLPAAAPVEFRVQGSLDPSPAGPFDAAGGSGLWLPPGNGDSAEVEIFVAAGTPPETLEFTLDAANLIAAGNAPAGASLGQTLHPEIDFACWADGTDTGNALAQAAGATAKVNFISDGNSYSCTGTLLNDAHRTRTPWFATAYHCIHDQATADTASFEWYFQAASCGGPARDPRYAQTGGGAQLLWADPTYDPTFLRLNKAPPSNAAFAGWDTGILVGDLAWGVHHPQGDYTKVSEGRVTGLLQTQQDGEDGSLHVLDAVQFFAGGTEPGSSGSGLFTLAGGSAYWRGTLYGGPQNNYQIASYSHLASYYAKIKPWLENYGTLPAPLASLGVSPASIDYLGSATLAWSSTYASACTLRAGDGGAQAVATSGSQRISPAVTTTYTLFCAGSGGSAGQTAKLTVNPVPARLVDCLFNWAEKQYPLLLVPAGVPTQSFAPYAYRFYWYTGVYTGVSAADNHVYFLGRDGALQDLGNLSDWLARAACR
jgi:hypothetical protein